MKKQIPDIKVIDHGTVWHIEGNTDAGKDWLREFVAPVESWAGTQESFFADWRPARDLVNGARADGLVIG